MVITAASTSFEGPISRLIAILLGREGTVERERKGLANHSRSMQERLSLSQLARMAPASRDIHSVVIVVKFDLAKGHERQVQILAGLKRKISEQLNVTKILGGKMRRQRPTGRNPTHHIRLQTTGGIALAAGLATGAGLFSIHSGALIVSSSVSSSTYAGTAATVTVGQTLPGGGIATNDGTYPNVFENAKVDGSFGVHLAAHSQGICPPRP
jgi:hypothetical protein